MKLYEINEAILKCIDEETGEIINAEALDKLQMEKSEKIENVACWIKDLTAEAAALKAEKQALAERQRVAENKAASLKEFLKYALNGGKFTSTRASISFRKSQQVEVNDINALMNFDDSLVKFAEPTPDKTAIKQALKDGLAVKGAKLIDSVSVIIK